MHRGAWWATVHGGAESAQPIRMQCVAVSFVFEAVDKGPCLSITICPLCDGHFSGFHLLASVNLGLQIPAFNSLGYVPRSRIAGSWGNSLFNFLRNCLSYCSPYRKKKKLLNAFIP